MNQKHVQATPSHRLLEIGEGASEAAEIPTIRETAGRCLRKMIE